jgi:hypothetical protein
MEKHLPRRLYSIKSCTKKTFFVVLLLAVLVVGGISAQEKKGYIKPTFGVGFFTADSISGAALSLDVDFVNRFGLTLGLQDLMAWNSGEGIINPVGFGVGYTYDGRKWSLGGKLMVMPFEVLEDGAIGFDINGTYWFTENLGITGIMDIDFLTEYDTTLFSMRVGVSLKF